jgi:hypothetical protein
LARRASFNGLKVENEAANEDEDGDDGDANDDEDDTTFELDEKIPMLLTGMQETLGDDVACLLVEDAELDCSELEMLLSAMREVEVNDLVEVEKREVEDSTVLHWPNPY